MKYEKLKQLCKKKKRYAIIVWCCFIPALIMAMLCAVARVCSEQVNETFIGCCLIAGLAIIVAGIVFSRLEAKWYRAATDYVCIKIMDIVNEFGIDSSNFEIIQENPVTYRIGFHNQMVDYQELQAKIDEEVAAMNKITGDVTRVKLI